MFLFPFEQRISQLTRQQSERLRDLHLEVVVEEHVDEDKFARAANHVEHRVEDGLLAVAATVRVNPCGVGKEADVGCQGGLARIRQAFRYAPVPGPFLRSGTAGQVWTGVKACGYTRFV